VTRDQIQRAAETVLSDKLPLRDGLVLRQALAIAEFDASGITAVWKEVHHQLEASLPEATYRMWLAPVHVAAVRGGTIHLACADSIRTWVERRYRPMILRALKQAAPEFIEITFEEVT